MMLVEVGRVCIKKYGRDAGSRAVVTAIEKDGFLNETVDVKNKELVDKALGISERPKEQRKS
jgi:ribosomal protein L14E/L6E/L27E